MLAGERVEQPVRGLLDRAVAETQRLEDLVQDLLAHGRPAQPQWKEVRWPEMADMPNGVGSLSAVSPKRLSTLADTRVARSAPPG